MRRHFSKMQIMTVEHRILFIIALVGCLLSIISVFSNIYLKLGWIPTLAAVSMSAVALYSLHLIYNKMQYRGPAYGALIFFNCIALPVLWFSNGGITGSIPYYFIFGVALTALLFNKLCYRIVLTLQVITLLILVTAGYHYPHLIVGYPSRFSMYMDITITVVIIGFFMFFMLLAIMREYHRAIDEIQLAHDALQETNEALYRSTITDELTGLYNRRFMLKSIESRFENGTLDFALLMIDIDHFKKVNDTYGHIKGDNVLVGVGAALTKVIGEKGRVARYGGEEFLMCVTAKSVQDAVDIGEDIRQAVNELTFDSVTLPVTISCGVQMAAGCSTLDEALGKADMALYQAKRSGRNRVEVLEERIA